jgi:hypothetical protein
MYEPLLPVGFVSVSLWALPHHLEVASHWAGMKMQYFFVY